MAPSEDKYIKLCVKQLEKRYNFVKTKGSLQRNLETISEDIEKKTGIYISLSTLKRIWKNDFKQSPQLATLNALANILEHKNWQDLKQSNPIKEKRFSPISLLFLALIILSAGAYIGIKITKAKTLSVEYKPTLNGPVYFYSKKTVSKGIPNTVIFDYDLSNVKADSFFIQQSWNPAHKTKISADDKSFSTIYYESGYHRARLIANNEKIAMQAIHIISDGWEPHIYYSYQNLVPIDFRNESFIKDGKLHLSNSLLEKKNVDFSQSFFSRISNSQKFNVSSNNFCLTSRIKVDSLDNSLCPWFNIIVVTTKHIFNVLLQKKGCETYAGYKLGEIARSGNNHDLSALGRNIFDWQEVSIKVKDKNAEIIINGETVINEIFKEEFGDIVGLIYISERTGSIDYVSLSGQNGKLVYEDDFER